MFVISHGQNFSEQYHQALTSFFLPLSSDHLINWNTSSPYNLDLWSLHSLQIIIFNQSNILLPIRILRLHVCRHSISCYQHFFHLLPLILVFLQLLVSLRPLLLGPPFSLAQARRRITDLPLYSGKFFVLLIIAYTVVSMSLFFRH